MPNNPPQSETLGRRRPSYSRFQEHANGRGPATHPQGNRNTRLSPLRTISPFAAIITFRVTGRRMPQDPPGTSGRTEQAAAKAVVLSGWLTVELLRPTARG